MESVLLDAAGHRRSPATLPGYHCGRPPRNKGERYPADPPTVEEIVAVMRVVGDRADGQRLRALIVLLWRAGLRVSGAALVIAIVAIAAVAIATGNRTTSAYAIQVRPGGKVAVSIYKIGDAKALQRSLRAAGVPAVVDFEATKAGPCVVAAGMNASPEKAGAGDEANETRHLAQSESRVPRGTAPGAGEAGENAAIQVHTSTAKGATNVTVSRFVVDPSRIRAAREALHRAQRHFRPREGSERGFLPEAAIVAIAAIAGATTDLTATADEPRA